MVHDRGEFNSAAEMLNAQPFEFLRWAENLDFIKRGQLTQVFKPIESKFSVLLDRLADTAKQEFHARVQQFAIQRGVTSPQLAFQLYRQDTLSWMRDNFPFYRKAFLPRHI